MKIFDPRIHAPESFAIEHLRHVASKLGISLPTRIRCMETNSYFLVRFPHQGEEWVYRYAISGGKRIQRLVLAFEHFSNTSFMPKCLYFDEACLIEQYAGESHTEDTLSDDQLKLLACSLSSIHAKSSQGFGWLLYDRQGEHQSLQGFIHWTESDLRHVEEQKILTGQELSRLKNLCRFQERWNEKIPGLVHGDVRLENLHWHGTHLKMIDWDRIGSMPREYDFLRLVSQIPTKKMQTLLKNYQYSEHLDWSFIRYFALLDSLRHLVNNRDDTGIFQRAATRIKLIMDQSDRSPG